MTLIGTAPPGPVPAEQVYEIKAMAESGQIADALIRLRKIKPLYPRNTFLVALEKQLERLLVLPRGSEPSEQQRKELLSSLPALIKGATESLRQQQPARPEPAVAEAPPRQENPDKDTARTQLKEQYFKHADEYLKKGAYGSALVEIRRVKIIAPDDPTAAEYERTIRQLVELQQRTGMKTQDQEQNAPDGNDSPRTGVEASPTPAPPVREFDETTVPLSEAIGPVDVDLPPPQKARSRTLPVIVAVVTTMCMSVAALALFSNPEGSLPVESAENPAQSSAGATDQQASPASESSAEVIMPAAWMAEPQQAEIRKPVSVAQDVEPPTAAAPEKSVNPSPEKRAGTAETVREEPVAEAVPAEVPQEESVATDSDPVIVHLEEPIFPASDQILGGEVIVMVQIDPDGKPIKTLVAKSTNPALNSPIVTAVLRSTYRPGTTPEGPATKWLTIPFRL